VNKCIIIIYKKEEYIEIYIYFSPKKLANMLNKEVELIVNNIFSNNITGRNV
jgi:3-methyladenine DNA glycosylase Tag